MRRLSLSWSNTESKESDRATAGESEYVSLADLPVHSGSSHSLSLVFHNDGDGRDGLAPLSLSDTSCIRRIQDALLLVIIGLCLLLACWACTQVYSGRLCVRANVLSKHSAVVVEPARKCVYLNERHAFASRGGPDLVLQDGSFDGGWPLSQTLLHVFSCVALLLCVAAMRLQSSTIHHSLAWVWFCFLLLSILLLDALRLWRWRGPTCALLQEAVASLLGTTGVAATGQCVASAYERFVTMEMVLVLVLVALVILEPVLFRLWCGNGHGASQEETESNGKEKGESLQQEETHAHD